MAATFSRVKVQSAVLDYRVDWSDLLGSDTIDTATWTVTGATGLGDTATATTTTARISGGSAGAVAKAVCHIVTDLGYEYERTIDLGVVARIELVPIIKAPGELIAVPAPSWADLGDDTISAYAWTAAAGLTVVSGYAATAITRISGGTLGSDYALTCTITTASGQIDARVIPVQVRER